MTGTCQTCKHWDRHGSPYWSEAADDEDVKYSMMRMCDHPKLQACGQHEASPNAVDTAPHFGCNQWEENKP